MEKQNNDVKEEGQIVDNDMKSKEGQRVVQSDEVTKLKDDLVLAKDKYLRLYAEFENHRRRTAKEKLEWLQTANENLLRTFLPVLDDFERAEKNLSDKETKDAEGFILIHNKFKKILEQLQVTCIDIKNGEAFNPDFQEAISQLPGKDESMKGKIVEVIEKGYMLHDKVLRFAKVVVGS